MKVQPEKDDYENEYKNTLEFRKVNNKFQSKLKKFKVIKILKLIQTRKIYGHF